MLDSLPALGTAHPRPRHPAFAIVICTCTGKQAPDDGVLVDVPETAREAGFWIPVAITRTVWNRIVALPDGHRGFQDETRQQWHLLRVARHYALGAADKDRIAICVHDRNVRKDLRDSRNPPHKRFPILAIGPGDTGEPIIAIKSPEDD